MKIAVQLYNFRNELARDYRGTLRKIAEMGFDGVEFAGFYGHSAEAVKEMLDRNGLVAVSSHVQFSLIENDMFGTIATNTIILAIATAPTGFLLSYVLAWFINEFNPAVRSFLSFLFYAPNLAGNAYFIWQTAFSGDAYGYINSLLLSVGLLNEPITWLKNPDYIVPIIIFVTLWASMGAGFLANIAGLQGINTSLFEAGAIDGIRNRWQELWYITLPSMKEILLFSAVMQIASSFSIGAVITTMCGYPTVNNCADTIVMYLTDIAHTRMEMGYAAAISIFLFAIMAIFRNLVSKLLSKTGK